MRINEVNISLIKPRDGLVGFASVVLDDAIYLGSIGIHKKLDNNGYRLTYPTKKVGAQNMDIFHPINHSASKKIEEAVLNKLKDVMKRTNEDVGYNCNFNT